MGGRFLVTGGAGFIGSHIVEKLLKDGCFVRVLDNFSSGKRENLTLAGADSSSGNFELIEADIRDKQACGKAARGIDYILHQAALRSVPKSLQIPHEFNMVNIDGTLNLLEASLDNKVKRFVCASSSSIYGDAEKFPEEEDDRSKLISPYALTKLANEYYCRIFTENYGLETVSLRYFNVFGPRQALDDEYAVVIPKFIHSILNDEQPPIFGTGKQSRDFTYIDNVVQANILSTTTKGIRNEVFNVALGEDTTVLELVECLNKIIGKDIKPKFLPARPGDVFRTRADISRIKSKLGFNPAVNFEEGMKRTVNSFRSK